MRRISRPFKPRARLLLQLGDQLIRNEQIALFELVKNAYDADASFVRVIMRLPENTEKQRIIIEDDGSGMDLYTVTNVWMEPGTDYRAKQFERREKTPKFKRLPIGEKGIGRFAAHKLGNIIEMVTRKKHRPEVTVRVDWRAFESAKYLSKVRVVARERVPRLFRDNTTGTRIKITQLRSEWGRGMVRDAYRAVTSIINPFELKEARFDVDFSCPDTPDYIQGLMTPEQIQEFALWHSRCDMKDSDFSMNFSFTPWSSMEDRIAARKKIIREDILDPDERKPKKIDLSECKIGKLRLDLYVYDRDPSVLRLLLGSKAQLQKYLDSNGGIRVYRDGIRVYDYGEKGNDWLDLDMRRVNEPTAKISNNIVVGAVFLNREQSEDLVEKTNREGFVENEAYFLFKKAVLFAVSRVENERYIDKLDIRSILGPTKKTEPVYDAFNVLRTKIHERIPDAKLQEELINEIDRAEKEYGEVMETLLRSSGAGLSLSVVLHEFEKILKELLLVVEREESSERIAGMVHRLDKLAEGFTALIRRDKLETHDLREIIKQALFNFQLRLEAHYIQIVDGFSEVGWVPQVPCYRNYVLMALMNILDNAIWWLARKYDKVKGVKKIFIKTTKEIRGGTAIVIADNGPGFSIPTEYAVKPFVTTKPGGMGLGLYITDEIMRTHKGQLIFPENGDVSLPTGMKGAVVGLLFKEGALNDQESDQTD